MHGFLPCLLILQIFHASAREEVAVSTSLTKFIGIVEDEICVFKGIPYAEPPVGKLRFQPPRPKRSYPNPFHALEYSAECLQSELFATVDRPRMSEDCLYLNIWSPAIPSTSKSKSYPVMVWIYGGAFLQGGANKPLYAGQALAKRGVVVVSFNYRLGALGFLVSTSDGLFGNYGLGDQKLALQWVRDHISAFSGDAERITVFGESAGAMSIGLQFLDQQLSKSLALSPTSKLFNSIILQSNPLGYRLSMIILHLIHNVYLGIDPSRWLISWATLISNFSIARILDVCCPNPPTSLCMCKTLSWLPQGRLETSLPGVPW